MVSRALFHPFLTRIDLLMSKSWASVQKDQAKIKSCQDLGQERLASIAFEDATSARIVD